MAAQARAGLAQAENGAAVLAALYQPAPRAQHLLRVAASSALFRPSNQAAGGPAAPGGSGQGFQEGPKPYMPCMPGVAEDHAMPPAPALGWRGLGTRTSREDPGEGSSGGPSPRAAGLRSPLAPADALQAARALLSSRDSRRAKPPPACAAVSSSALSPQQRARHAAVCLWLMLGDWAPPKQRYFSGCYVCH